MRSLSLLLESLSWIPLKENSFQDYRLDQGKNPSVESLVQLLLLRSLATTRITLFFLSLEFPSLMLLFMESSLESLNHLGDKSLRNCVKNYVLWEQLSLIMQSKD